jgi:peroxin-14
VEEQKIQVDKATEDVQNVVSDMRQGESRTRDELREIRDEVDNIREMLPKVCPSSSPSPTFVDLKIDD